VAESGTDIWLTANNKTNTQQMFYYEAMTTSTNATNKLFKQAYSMINTCNTVINRASGVVGDARKIDILVGEAKTLRAFYYLVLVTHYGNITLFLDESGENTIITPKRNTVEEIYTQIIKDLKEAAADLDVKPLDDNYARISKKAALGLLARAYAQGAGEDLSEDGKSYWERACEVSEDLIKNMASYGAYMYEDVEDVWAHANNRGNKEALFVASGPQAGTDGFTSGSYSANKLFTFTFANPSKLSDIYATADRGNYFYGRVNNNLYAPSRYLVDCFSEYDKRWENSFVTAFSEFSMKEVAWVTYESKIKELSAALCTKYGIDAKHIGKKIYPYVDVNAINLGSNGGNQYVAKVWPKGDYSADVTKLVQPKNVYVHPYPLAADEDRFIVYLSKQALSAADKAERAYITVNIDDLFDSEGKYISSTLDGTDTYQLFPSLSKFNWSYEGLIYGSNLQCKTGDMFVMRMAEVYLIAAEANLKTGNAGKAAEHLNVLRKRACRNAADYEAHMKLTTVTLDTVMDEYARELCGEFSRWALLKRHKAFEDRLGKYNKRAAASFKPVNYLRPISYDFLSQIDNADEYGTNGY
ncbi:RagB/SusD family nutrient uptake outer membrane protein, partial [Bacteroidales bacterium OttesenSCG-928-L03]|nr:RagB/SusD family nutrient uptake outer membrane protein [Bacteroidales bacterium OttesenSCG-928-L03]